LNNVFFESEVEMEIDLTEKEIKFIHDILLDYMERNIIEGTRSSTMQMPFNLLNKMKNNLEEDMNSEKENSIEDRYVLGFVDDEDETWCFVDLDSYYTSIG
jgi:hypothetical protein